MRSLGQNPTEAELQDMVNEVGVARLIEVVSCIWWTAERTDRSDLSGRLREAADAGV